MIYVFNVEPIGKPRMTQSDKWNDRKAVTEYWAFKDQLNYMANLQKFRIGKSIEVIFLLPMPASWSGKKRLEMLGLSHETKPDTDNLLKAFCDALTDDDSSIWEKKASKFWWNEGKIVVVRNEPVSGELRLKDGIYNVLGDKKNERAALKLISKGLSLPLCEHGMNPDHDSFCWANNLCK